MSENETNYSYRDLLSDVFRKKRLLFCGFASVLLPVVAVCFLLPPTYEASTKLLVKRNESILNNVVFLRQVDSINTEIEIISSRRIIEKVIKELDLKDVWAPFRLFDFRRGESASSDINKHLYEKLKKNIIIVPVEDSEVVQIFARARDPNIAARIADSLAQTYIQERLAMFGIDANRDFEILDLQLSGIAADLEKAEEDLNAFSQQFFIFENSEQEKLDLARLSYFETMLAENQADSAHIAGQIQALTSKLATTPESLETTVEHIYNPYLRSLTDQLVAAEEQYTNIKRNYKPGTRSFISAEEQVRNIREKIINAPPTIVGLQRTERNPIYSNMEEELTQFEGQRGATELKEVEIEKIVSELRQYLTLQSERAIAFARLKRTRDLLESSYKLYRQKLEEAKLSARIDAVKLARVEVLEQAAAPERPIRPRPELHVPLGIFAGLLFALALLFISLRFENVYSNPDDLRKHLRLQVLATINKSPD